MDSLLASRLQMELSLGFHMIFASVGMAMPAMMLIAEGRWLRTRDPDALRLARTWGQVTAVLFVIGAVSGTALSFELGLLWPRFMEFAGPLIGLAFTLEAYAFFIEAIFLGLYLYGWDRLSPMVHWLTGWPVALSGAASGILVLSANSWMQNPVGFDMGLDRLPTNLDPVAAFFNPAWPLMAAHSTLATYQAVGFAAAGSYAWALLRGLRPERAGHDRLAITIAMILAATSAAAQPLLGDLLAKRVHLTQPAKLAAAEGQFKTERGAPLRIGGWPDLQRRETPWAIEIPKGLSFLATRDFNGEVVGLEAFARDEWPNVHILHASFQVMVGAGFATLAVGLWFWWAWWRGRRRQEDWAGSGRLLWALVLCAPLGFLALEAGWIVTEVGRQPWVIYGVMRTSEAGTPVEGAGIVLTGFALLYAGLATTLAFLLGRLARAAGDATPTAEERPARARA